MKDSDSAFAAMILCYIATSVTQNHWMFVLTAFWLIVWGYRWFIEKKNKMIPKQRAPTQEEFDDAYYALYQISCYYMKMIYGVPRPTLEKVLKFLYKLGQDELDKIESLKYEPAMKAPEFPEYVMEGNELVMVHKHLSC